jgi:GNAT superfamily N-acetyltransferase
MRLALADEALRDLVQDGTFPIWSEGLTRPAYGRWNDAQMRTAWGRERLHRLALLDDEGRWLASLKRYRFAARLDGEAIEVTGVGAVFTPPELRGRGYARRIVEEMLEQEARRGAALAALFSEIGAGYYRGLGFAAVPLEEVTLSVTRKDGAPAMLVRSGTDADLASIAAMHDARAAGARFALVRTPDLIQYSIAKRRLLAGLGTPGRRRTEFFVAEEGLMAVAYVVITADEHGWFVEEAGDRDPAAARLGAILQVLVAREPAERVPVIRSWWPVGFPAPPQVTIVSRTEPHDIFMVRPLRGGVRPLTPADVFYWRSDYF